MGYDVSFHPISPEEMQEWYFGSLTWVQQGREEKVLALAAQYGMEDFYAEKYLDTLRVGAGTGPDELFDKSHGFYIAVIQGSSGITFTPEGAPFLFWWSKSQNMPGILLRGSRSCRLPFPIRQKTGSLKITALACTCLRIRRHSFSRIWSRTKRFRKIWKDSGVTGSLRC